MPRPRPPYLHCERNRHGDRVWYVRRDHGQRMRLRAEYASSEFWAEYRGALEGAPPASTKTKPHTLAWALERYRASSAWTQLAPATRRQRENIFRAIALTAGGESLADIDQAAIVDGRERRKSTPHSANNFLKAMRGFFAWATGDGKLVKVDPIKGVALLKGKNDEAGFHTWTEEEVARFEDRWPTGTRERLAFDILLYTGLRRGDAVRLGRQHVRDGVITIRAEKTGEELVLALLQPLAESIAASPRDDMTFLVTERGEPFVKEGFGNWFREACRKAGCPGSAHGLRKAGATRAADNGASDRQLMAMYGWTTAKMATHYTNAANKKRLARDGAQLLLPARMQNKKRPHLSSGAGVSAKTKIISGD